MSSPNTISHTQIVDNHPPDAPAFPDLSRLGKSRIGKKLVRKALDRYYREVRIHEGPARSGPPVPNSEKKGQREFYPVFPIWLKQVMR